MAIKAEDVKTLREKTGAGMMDCRKALEESNGDMEKAVEFLRKRGIASAEKRVGRTTNQGIVESYIHTGGRIGSMVELNCETDFVAKTDDFKLLAREIAMQVAAMNPRCISREQVEQSLIDKEIEIYRAQAKSEGKPEAIADKIAQGRLDKFYQDVCLLEQSYVKDPGKSIKDVVTEIIAKTGENIMIKRFVRFHLGEDGQS
ncbi:MAG: translation elongation factor Ts [Ignavibacteriales bacterium]|nr:translation elongation factor Ts [Ignavibacteriales bacterium]